MAISHPVAGQLHGDHWSFRAFENKLFIRIDICIQLRMRDTACGHDVAALNPSVDISMTTSFLAIDWYSKVAWASSDLSLFSPASALFLTYTGTSASTIASTGITSSAALPGSTAGSPSNQVPSSPTATPGTTVDAATSTSTTAVNKKPALSAGADAGIGIGVAVELILIAALAGWLIFRMQWQLLISLRDAMDKDMESRI
ncbi:hypothetical protein EJ03DRAFT_384703 [Teratosphaeria nubilosa]|uniref:Uncharacterized protein n=1 Tax=Teratosphaeria nubilosa TaxID=161662 RepID=A0A6G1L1X9_9PEZI|nr:hypothetical protein EJ03DRAFT_384703 [Teratosphaeria nubilosa]